jgi:hypothetical protein
MANHFKKPAFEGFLAAADLPAAAKTRLSRRHMTTVFLK